MKVGGLTETVYVPGDSPLVDVTSSSTDNGLNQYLLFNFPIRYGNVAGQPAQQPAGYRQPVGLRRRMSSSGNALLIHGVDTPDPSGRTPWTFYNFNIVEEVQAIGIGAPGRVRGVLRRGDEYAHQVRRQPRLGSLRRHVHQLLTWPAPNIYDSTAELNPVPRRSGPTNQQREFTTQLSAR